MVMVVLWWMMPKMMTVPSVAAVVVVAAVVAVEVVEVGVGDGDDGAENVITSAEVSLQWRWIENDVVVAGDGGATVAQL